MLKIINDPILFVIKAFEELFPKLSADIQFVNDLEGAGRTTIPDDGRIPLIDISVNIPISALPEILSHELAHIVVPDREHKKEWETTFDIIFNRAIELYYQDYNSYKTKNKI
jgi:hypothetical protein